MLVGIPEMKISFDYLFYFDDIYVHNNVNNYLNH
jgi:hypothetical protein